MAKKSRNSILDRLSDLDKKMFSPRTTDKEMKLLKIREKNLLEMLEVQLEASTESRLFFKTKEKMQLERVREQIKTLNWILS